MAIQGGQGGGGGASAAAIQAGGAEYTVTAKDGFSKVLDKMETRVKGFRSFMQRTGTALFAGGAGVLGAGTAGAVVATMRLYDNLVGASIAFNRQLERSAQLDERLNRSMQRRLAERAESIELVTNPIDKMAALQEAIAADTAEMQGFDAAANNARKRLDELGDLFSRENLGDRLQGTHEGFVSQAEGDLQRAKTKSDELSESLAKSRRELFLLMNPEKNPRLNADISSAIEKIREDINTAHMTAGEKAEREFIRRGATPGQLAEFRDTAQKKEAIDKDLAFEKKFAELHQRLADEAKFEGLSAEQRSVVELMAEARAAGIKTNFTGLIRMAQRTQEMAGEVKGGIGAASASQRFGFGDTAAKQQVDLLKVIAGNTQPAKISAALAAELEMR